MNVHSRIDYLKRGLKNRCPRCGEGAVLKSLFVRHENCPHCDMKYDREQGFFSAAMAINYVIICVCYLLPMLLIWLAGLLPGMATIVLCFLGAMTIPVFTYRYSQSAWLGLYYFLTGEISEEEDKNR